MNEQPVILHVCPNDSGSFDKVEFHDVVQKSIDPADAVATVSETNPAVVVCEQELGGDVSGLDILDSIRNRDQRLPVVLVTDDPDGTVAARATQLGVTEYVPRTEVDLEARLETLLAEQTSRNDPVEETTRRLDIALEGTTAGIYEWDLDTGEVVWDEATASLFGTTPQVLDGTIEDLHEYVHPADLDDLETAFRSAKEDSEPFDVEVRVTVDSETRWIYTNGTVETQSNGSRRLIAIASDVTAQKERERELEANNESLEKLTQLATTEDLSRDAIIERVLELGIERLGLSIGFLTQIDGDRYEVSSVVGESDVIQPGVTTELQNTFCRRIFDGDELFGIRDVASEGWEDDVAHQISGLACYLGGQVVVDGELYGTLCFGDEEPRSNSFSESERTYLRLLAEWVSHELERRKRSAELERYEDIIEAVDDGVYALDSDGNFQFVNEAMTELTGYRESALLDSHTGTIKSPEVVERAKSIVRSMIFGDRDEEETFDLEIVRADGTAFPAEDHMTLLRDESDSFEGTAGIIRDITERKEREQELRAARKRIEEILERIGDAFFAVDDTWEITYWNSRAAEILGRQADEALGENLWDLFPEAAGLQFHDAYHRAMETQEVVTFEEYYPPVDKWFRVSAYPSQDGLSVYFHDVTDQKERDRKLSGLLETTRSLMHARTPEEVAETVIQATEDLLGFDLALVRLFDEEMETLVPTAATEELPDRPVYDAHEGFPGEAFQRTETIRVDDFETATETYDNRYAKAGMYIPLGSHGVISVAETEREAFDEADVSVAEILASNATAALDRVEREQNLLRYETVVENVSDMVFVLDEQNEVQLVTKPLASWLGFDRTELIGSRPERVLDAESIRAFERQLATLGPTNDESTSMETTLETADGEQRPAEIEISRIDDDIFAGTVGVVRDLTELVETREELQDERDRFTYLFDNLPDAVIEADLADGVPVIKSVNPAFTDVFGVDHSKIRDKNLNDLVVPPNDKARTEATTLDDRWARGETVQTELRRRTETGFRDFLFRGIPYRREDGTTWGFGIYTDITEQRDRERRLEVLNRVLRHNLRNDLTVVLGVADELATRIDDETLLDLLDRLRRKAEDVAAISDRARQIEQSARREEVTRNSVDVPSMVETLVGTYRSRFDGTISLSVPATPIEAADGRLSSIVGELLDNSMEHAGPSPAVSVDVTATSELVSITVSDDGPGIPPHEVDVLTGDEPITQLSHGSGLGLWLVSWVTESYGGSVTFDESDAGGARITLSIPRDDV